MNTYYWVIVFALAIALQIVTYCYHFSEHFQKKSLKRWIELPSTELRRTSCSSKVSEHGLLGYRVCAFLFTTGKNKQALLYKLSKCTISLPCVST